MFNLSKIKKQKTILSLIGICLLFLILKLIIYRQGNTFFDEGVYVSIAKYFASAGKIGYFESIRPLALSTLLIPFQSLPLSPLLTGRFLSLVLALGCLLIIYYITKKWFGERPALWAALLFSTSYSVLIFSGYILNDLPAYTLALLGTSLVLDKRFVHGGIAVGLGFLFKFPLLVIIPVLAAYLLIQQRKNFLLPAIKFSLGVALTALPYFLFNFFYYQGPILQRLLNPLLQASKLIEGVWLSTQSSLFIYFWQLLTAETILVLATILFLLFYLKTHQEITLLFFASILAFLIYFSFRVPRYDPRYLISLLPFLIVLGGTGLAALVHKKKKIRYLVFILVLLPGLITASISLIKTPLEHNPSIKELIQTYPGQELITNSGFPLLYSSSKVNLFSGPNLGHTYLTYKLNDQADWFIFDPDEFICPPQDKACLLELQQHLSYLLDHNDLLECGYLHGSKTIILTKNPNQTISKSACLEKIDYPEVPSPEVNTFLKLDALITSEGNLVQEERLLKLIKKAAENNLQVILVSTPSETPPNQKTQKILEELSTKIELQSVFEKQIDLSIVKDWSTGTLLTNTEFQNIYEALLNGDCEIVIHIPTYLLTEENYDKIIDYIGKI